MRFQSMKKILPLLFAFGLLAGCGTGRNDTGSKETVPASEPEHLSGNFEETALALTDKFLTVSGLQKDYTFLFLTDTHVITIGGGETKEEMENALPRMDLFQDGSKVSSAQRFPQWMQYANASDVDMVLFGGDIIDFPSLANLALLRENTEVLTMPYAYTLGNHDWTYPWEYMTETGRNTYRPLFAEFTKDSPAASVTEYEELVILSVDNSSNQVDGEALSITDHALSLGKPVLVLLHVPFSTETLLAQAGSVWGSPVSIGMADKGGIFPDANTLAFQEKILAKDSPVFCVLAGHTHFAEESHLNETVVQIVGDAGYKGVGTLLHISGEN